MESPAVRIFVALQMCCSGNEECCLAPGQSQKEIDDLAEGVKNEVHCDLKINEVRDVKIVDEFPAAVELFKKYGYNALPIVMVGGEIVSYGIPDKEFIINAINKFRERGR